MLQQVLLTFLLCTLPFQFNHSRYVLIDVYDDDNGIGRRAGCGDWCFGSETCYDPVCPYCVWVTFPITRCVHSL